MSSTVGDLTPVSMRQRLTQAAAGLVASGGAATLSARRVAREAGTSTMAVYTHFGSMEALVGAVVDEGYDRLEELLAAVAEDDPVLELAGQTAAYVAHARENPELYAVMFGVAHLASYRPATPEQLAVGRQGTLDRIGATLARAVGDGRLREAGGSALAFRWWVVVHGYVMLEGSGYIDSRKGLDRVLGPLLVDFLVGEGDRPELAAAAVRKGLGAPGSSTPGVTPARSRPAQPPPRPGPAPPGGR